jgi:post-segregation antitoxin (ccd killing protein)
VSTSDISIRYHTVMATRTTFTLDEHLAEQARELGVNISAAARQGVAAAVHAALAENDRIAYERHPEEPEPFWTEAEAWSAE